MVSFFFFYLSTRPNLPRVNPSRIYPPESTPPPQQISTNNTTSISLSKNIPRWDWVLSSVNTCPYVPRNLPSSFRFRPNLLHISLITQIRAGLDQKIELNRFGLGRKIICGLDMFWARLWAGFRIETVWHCEFLIGWIKLIFNFIGFFF